MNSSGSSGSNESIPSMAIQIKHKRKHIEIIHQKTSTVSSPALPKAGDGSDAPEKDSKAMSDKKISTRDEFTLRENNQQKLYAKVR